MTVSMVEVRAAWANGRCPRDHELTPENIGYRKPASKTGRGAQGIRYCKRCRRERDRSRDRRSTKDDPLTRFVVPVDRKPPNQLPTPGWERRAACKDTDPDDFFVADGQPVRPVPEPLIRTALTVCADCPVRSLCAATADYERRIGLWGGELRYYRNTDPFYQIVSLIGRSPTVDWVEPL